MLEARSFAQIDTTRSSEPSQMLCEVYFCAMVYRQPASAGSNFSYQQQIVRVTRRYSVCVCVSLSSFSTCFTKQNCLDAVFRLECVFLYLQLLGALNTNPRCTNIQKSISLPKRRTEPGSLKSNSERSSVKIACNTENIQWRVQRELVQNCGSPRLMR
ncbi:Hypothetical_protein [Hexamita inflata]|uniref:Hypothetical_protein n=1 Tax=Hexamita inflata TaxID=28002 RepID=A0AA86R8Z2_9EUKA|nr:Hypothetical protein HINF_LOCUS51385 [Hexamita inflata]